MRIVIVIAFIVIIGAMVSAGIRMMRSGRDGDDPARRNRMVRALTLRVAVSVALFVFILVAWQLGWIEPTGIPLAR